MLHVRAAQSDGIHVILCLKFSPMAPFDELAELKQALIESDWTLHCVEVSGAFDFMLEAGFDDLAQYQRMLDRLKQQFGHLAERYEANFVCRHYIREIDDFEDALWVPCASGQQRIDCAHIDKICAEGDYVRLHCGTRSWLYHETMRDLVDHLDPTRFQRLHRSLIVRTDFICRLIHNSRSWTARLIDGTEHRIAKARSAKVLAALRTDSSMAERSSAKLTGLGENPGESHEITLFLQT